MSRSEFPQDLHHVSSLLIRTSALIPSGCPCGASCTWRNLESGKQITSEHPKCVSSVSALPSPLVAQRSEVVGGRKLRQSWLPSGVRALSVEFEGGSFFTGTCEWTRTGTCQERGGVGKASIAPCAQIRRQRGGMGGVGGRQEGFSQPSGHLHHLWEPELSHRMGRQESWSDSTEDSDGRGVSMLVTYLRVGNKSRLT